MVSTYLSYRLYSADLAKSLTREASLKAVSREAEYYKASIGSVKSVDDLLKNTRIYTYAMKAYGLEDMTYAKAFMRKVLESDLTDANSFVRKLSDTRFLTFAEAFNFSTDGTIKVADVVAQDSVHEEETIGLYSDRRIKQGATLATEAEYFRNKMATITSVDDLIGNSRLLNFTLKTYGIDSRYASPNFVRNVLTSDPNDPSSFANQQTNTAYAKLAAAFSFQTDGSVAPGGTAQTAAQTTETVYQAYETAGLGASPAAAAFKSQYFQTALAGVTSVDDIVGDPKLVEFIATAFGFDPITISAQRVRDVLTSDLSDPGSAANTLGSVNYKKMAEAFNFNTDGSLDTGVPAQSATQLDTTLDGYMANYKNKAAKSDTFDEAFYRISIPSVKTVDQILTTPKLYSYILNAFGIDPTSVGKETVRKVLQSDLSDPTSFVNSTRDTRFKKLAEAFNFDAEGNAQTQRLAQTQSGMRSTMLAYVAAVGDPDVEQAETKAENDYYRAKIEKLQSLDELLADQRAVTYLRTAYGLKESVETIDVLRQILTSDLEDRTSFANQSKNGQYRVLAGAFNFNSDGTVFRETMNAPQDRQDMLTTADLYLRQLMEEKAGDNSEAVRLALYFQRKAPSITSAFSILADKALFQVVRTALGLPDTMSLADLDTQATMINRKLDIADLKDPEKLEKFIARYSALSDINTGTTSQQSLVSILFGN